MIWAPEDCHVVEWNVLLFDTDQAAHSHHKHVNVVDGGQVAISSSTLAGHWATTNSGKYFLIDANKSKRVNNHVETLSTEIHEVLQYLQISPYL